MNSSVTKAAVDDVSEAALAVPIDPRLVDPNLSLSPENASIGEDDSTMEIELDGQTLKLRANESAIRQCVSMAYLVGGFDLICSLHRQVRYRINIENLGLSQVQSAVREIRTMRKDPQIQGSYDRALSEQTAQILPRQRRVKTAETIERLVCKAWTKIATAEEQVLREYEPLLSAQFAHLAMQARDLALKEWLRYEPYDKKSADSTPLNTSEAKERGARNLNLRKEGPELVKSIRDLHSSWSDYLDALNSMQTFVGLGASRIQSANPHMSPREQVRYSRLHVADKFNDFDRKRDEIGSKYPAAMQVYAKFDRRANSDLRTKDEEIEGWVIEALIEAVESAQEIGYQAVTKNIFKKNERLRVEPDEVRRASNFPAYQQSILADGLTIPASRVIANAFVDPDDAAKSAWFQLPVRSALAQRGKQGEERLAPYVSPGRLHHAALSDLNNALQEVRQKRKEKMDQALLLMDAVAVPLGFFTGGSSMAIAGTIHAIVRGREMYISISEYQAKDELAQIALVPMQQVIWDHPSAITLAGKLFEDGFEIATDLVNGGVAGAILDVIQVSLAIGYGAQAVAEWAAGDELLGDH